MNIEISGTAGRKKELIAKDCFSHKIEVAEYTLD
ncbi:hypothetical protein NVIRENTERO_00577 [Sodalis praecaptivus]|nr:hypothetical protein NVIRENTERO_00577 [Sodalis praecaptivus]